MRMDPSLYASEDAKDWPVLKQMRDVVTQKLVDVKQRLAVLVRAPPSDHVWKSVRAVSAHDNIGRRNAMEVSATLTCVVAAL